MNQEVKSYIQEEYNGLIFYIKNNSARCIRGAIEGIIMSTLMVSWIFYIMKPFLEDANNYGVTMIHPSPIAVIGIAGFVFLSFFFLLTTGWYYINKYLFKVFGSHIKPEIHYKSNKRPSDEVVN